MIGFMVAFLIFILASFNVFYFFKINYNLSFVISALLIIVVLYLFGLFNILAVGCWAILSGVVILSVYSFIKIIKNKEKNKFKFFYSKSFIILLCFVFIQVLVLFTRRLYQWDEFSHWGLIVKNMNAWNTFAQGAQTSTVCNGYPPAISLFLYFFQFFHVGFWEPGLFIAMNTLIFSLLIVGFVDRDGNNILHSIISILLILVTPIFIYKTFYTNLQLDAILGVIFAVLLWLYFKDKEINEKNFLLISLIIFVLTISKDSGVGLSILALLIIYIHILYHNRKELKLLFKSKKNLFLLILPILCLIIGKYSWVIYSKLNSIGAAWGRGSPESVLNVFKFGFSGTQKTIILRFVNAFSVYIAKYVLIFVLLLVISILMSKNKKYVAYILISTIAGFLIYALSLLYLYLFTFSTAEALGLASMDRYLNTYLLGVLIFYLFNLVNHDLFFEICKKSNILLIILITCLSACFVYHEIEIIKENKTTRDIHNYLSNLDSFVKTLDKEEDKIMFISPDDPGCYFVILHYTISPLQSNYDNNYDMEWFTSKEKLESLLLNYDYLYFIFDSPEFEESFSEYFEDSSKIGNDTIFKIDKSNNEIRLIYIPWNT